MNFFIQVKKLKRRKSSAVWTLLAVICTVGMSAVAFNHLTPDTRSHSSVLLGTAHGFSLPRSLSLTTIVAKSEVVLVGQIDQYTPVAPASTNSDIDNDATALLGLETNQPAGKYSVRVKRLLKGQTESTLDLNLPPLISIYYDSEQLVAHKGDAVLLMLEKSPQGEWLPVDSTLPLIRLANDGHLPIDKDVIGSTSENIQSQIENLMLASISDPLLRKANTYLLRNVVEPVVAQAIKKYAHDPDLRVRDHVLYCMAINQDVSAIPLIEQLEKEVQHTGQGSANSTGALTNFQIPQAIPYLNQLLFSASYFSRLNASDVLRDLANRTSVPFLMVALQDPDPQHSIDYNAYWTFHRLIPQLGPPKSLPYFQVRRDVEIQPIYQWWQDELQNKHANHFLTEQETSHPFGTAPISPDPQNLLFDVSVLNRRRAAATLSKAATRTDAPYLIAALQDPDREISYSAHTTLSRLIPTLKSFKNSAEYAANKKIADKNVYDWWEDELKGAHG